ncbi:hypothetical protein [Bradyrhizobium sp. 2S1]|uniref:hypothetical protein n=1 Tax=Bradyrhizobium sp. 2S1 TaxID=1404429 RepID=UPI00140D1B0A|nr:hypothetical protein [Bradyrhizobium sp. 2S1]MCK7667223.1 hypothetical protein [Bradyrhizobium sp. 2S1]
MAVTNEQIKSVAVLGTKGIELQLSLADKTVQEVFYQIWPFAYCYGVFEALTGHHRMHTVETYLLITVGFEELLSEKDGRKQLEKATQLQTNTLFVEGRAHGFDDFSQWVTSKDYRPLSRMNFFAFGKPAMK